MSDVYVEKQREIIKKMISDFKDYEYNSLCFEILKEIIRLNNTSFTIGDVVCDISNNDMAIFINSKTDFRELGLTLNNLKHLLKELKKIK